MVSLYAKIHPGTFGISGNFGMSTTIILNSQNNRTFIFEHYLVDKHEFIRNYSETMCHWLHKDLLYEVTVSVPRRHFKLAPLRSQTVCEIRQTCNKLQRTHRNQHLPIFVHKESITSATVHVHLYFHNPGCSTLKGHQEAYCDYASSKRCSCVTPCECFLASYSP